MSTDDEVKRKVVEHRFLDLCYKEGWTYDLKTREELLSFCWAHLQHQPLRCCTQKALRDSFVVYKRVNPDLLWNPSGSSDKRRLWAAHQELLFHRAFPQDPPVSNVVGPITWESIQEAATKSPKPSQFQEMYIDEWQRHLNRLAEDWGNFAPHDAVINKAIKEDYHLPCKPTESFVHQVLQDLETKHSYLSKVNGAANNVANNTTNNAASNAATAATNNAASIKVTTLADSQQQHSKSSFVGNRVFAEFPTNGRYYWGIITKEYYNVEGKKCYSIWFDDDDKVNDVTGEKIITQAYYEKRLQHVYRKEVPERPAHLLMQPSSDDSEEDAKMPAIKDVPAKNDTVEPASEEKVPAKSDMVVAESDGRVPAKNDTVEPASDERVPAKSDTAEPVSDANAAATFDSAAVFGLDDDSGDSGDEELKVLSLKELYDRRCNLCTMCKLSDCNRCVSCRFNEATNSGSQRQVCVRKMCLRIYNKEKPQPVPAFPPGWTFYFTSTTVRSNSGEPSGLVLMSPSGGQFREIGTAMNRNRKDFCDVEASKREFLKHIGEDDSHTSATILNNMKKTKKRKGRPKRVLSDSKEVGSRVFCKYLNDGYYWGEITQKFTVAGSSVSHFAVEFDDGDTMDDIADEKVNGDDNVCTEVEYKQILGINPPPRPAHLSPPAKRTKKSYTPEELYEFRCGKCATCKRKDCQSCDTCQEQENKSGHQRTGCCLQKIPRDERKQPAPGLPPGWTYVTGEALDEARNGVPGLLIMSPEGDHQFSSCSVALKHCNILGPAAEEAYLEFQAHIGGNTKWNDKNHYLYGKKHYQEWIDIHGKKCCLHGVITECLRDKIDTSFLSFSVSYNEQSRNHLLHAISARAFKRSRVPQTQKQNELWARGGHLAYLAKMKPASSTVLLPLKIPAKQWIVPDSQYTYHTKTPDDKILPCLVLQYKGFRLCFKVAPSSIPDAGFGVFVQVDSMFGDQEELVLKAGELLDLGIYAPFRPEDLKEESVFLLKNFVHNLKCEEWSFDLTEPGFQYDITNDEDGELHRDAAHHVPAYVNECAIGQCPTVHAEHDPEGVVHYLFGIHKADLVLPCEGAMEIYINYGKVYEPVRVRKGYSFEHRSNRPKPKSFADEAAEYFEEVGRFSPHDIVKCIEFFSGVAKSFQKNDGTLGRALAMTLLLYSCALTIQTDLDPSPFADAFRNHTENCLGLIFDLVERIGDAALSRLLGALEFDGLLSTVVRPFLENLPKHQVDRILSTFRFQSDEDSVYENDDDENDDAKSVASDDG